MWREFVRVFNEAVAVDYPAVEVARSFQPTTQGRQSGPALLIHRTRSRRYGAQGTITEIAPDASRAFEHSVWRKEDTIRATFVAPKTAAFDAQDVLETVAAYLQSEGGIVSLARVGIGLLRVNDIDEVPFENEKGAFEYEAGIDCVFTYTQTKTKEIPVIGRVERSIHRV